MGMRLYGVALLNGDGDLPLLPGAQLVRCRDLAAAVQPAAFAPQEPTPDALDEYRKVVDALFRRHAVLPAPFGTVLRSLDHVRRWLDVNHLALAEGLHFVEGRCEARVYVVEPKDAVGGDPSRDAGAVSVDLFRALRRVAVAAAPLKLPRDVHPGAASAFLLPVERWPEFEALLEENARRIDDWIVEHSGPWPPYDFVRMDLGA